MNKDLILRLAVFILSITQVLAPVFSSFSDNQSENNFDPPITPAGYTFAVWGVITLLGLCYGIYQLLPNRTSVALHQKVATRISVVYILFSLWLFAASKDWLWVSVVIFILMFGLLFMLFQVIQQNKQRLTFADKLLLEGQLGIYLGWSTIAIFANTASGLAYYDILRLDSNGVIIQSTLLVFALANSVYGVAKTNGNYFFSGTILWAFMGVFVGLRQNSNTEILQIVVIGAILVFVTFLVVNKLKFTKTKLKSV